MNIFIGSSSESVNYASSLKSILEEDRNFNFKVTIWKDAEFVLGETIIESLEKIKNLYECAIFIFHPDDEINFKSKTMKSVRDNVIFEFGLFVGVLGIKNCFAVIPDNIEIKQPSDILGVNYARYIFNESERNFENTLRTAANKIKSAIIERHKRRREHKDFFLERGDFRESIVDASVDVTISDYDLYDQWIQSIKRGEKIKEELLYWERKTAKKWLEYEDFTNQSFDLISAIGHEVKRNFNDSFDLISLGPGSGKKDIAFLDNAINRNSLYWYYPIDISSHLLFTTLKNVTGEFDDSTLKVKGIRANFISLEHLRFVYRYTNHLNIFTLFGNTLGNYPENMLINRVKRSMFDNDIFIIEVNNIEGFENIRTSKYNNRNYQEFILEPLKSLGISPKLSSLEFEEKGTNNSNFSTIKNSLRIFANYNFDEREMKMLQITSSKLNITYSTHYDKEEVKKFFEYHNFKFLGEAVDSHSIVLMFKK